VSSNGSGTSAIEGARRAKSPSSSTQGPLIGVCAPIPSANEDYEPVGQPSASQTAAIPIDEDVDEAVPVLSRVNPSRGSTSGGDEILLIVSNLPTTTRLYARFGSNIAPTVSVVIV